jgi:adenylate cyclase
MSYRLAYEDQGRRREFPLEGTEVSIGRETDNALVLANPSVSRHHASVRWDGRYWRIEDLRSRNGVKVNGRTIEPGEAGAAVLSDGDALVLGAFPMEFTREETEKIVLSDDIRAEMAASQATLSRVSDIKDLLTASTAAGTVAPGAQDAVARVERILRLVTSVGQRITGVKPLEEILESIVDLVFDTTPAERAALLLWDARAGRLVPKVVRGREGRETGELRVSRTVVLKAFDERCTVQMDPKGSPTESLHRLGIRSAVAVPLWDQERVTGVIYADTAIHSGAFDPFSASLLSALANYAAIAIEQGRLLQRIQQEERAKERLGRYHSRAVVERILATSNSSSDFRMETQEADVTVLFCDMENFTAMSENLPPPAVLLLLNEYFSRMTEVIFEHEGTLDKYIGDCIMAVFGAPLLQPDHARRAALTALGLREVVRTLNQKRADRGLDFRIGMASGKVVAGDLGHAKRREWTVLGATVNLASRLESSVARAGQIVVSGSTRALLGDEFNLRPVEFQRPKGISREFTVFELLERRP